MAVRTSCGPDFKLCQGTLAMKRPVFASILAVAVIAVVLIGVPSLRPI